MFVDQPQKMGSFLFLFRKLIGYFFRQGFRWMCALNGFDIRQKFLIFILIICDCFGGFLFTISVEEGSAENKAYDKDHDNNDDD